jgi:hypothetical protein
MDDKRSKSQVAADERYEAKRAAAPRFGGRCSVEEKQLLARLSEAEGISEKDLIFKALKYFEENS